MASQGQKFNNYTPEIKKAILKEYFDNNAGISFLSRKYGVPRGSIKTWIFKTNHQIDVKVDHRPGASGRPITRNLSLEDYKERYEILKKYQAFLQARREKK